MYACMPGFFYVFPDLFTVLFVLEISQYVSLVHYNYVATLGNEYFALKISHLKTVQEQLQHTI